MYTPPSWLGGRPPFPRRRLGRIGRSAVDGPEYVYPVVGIPTASLSPIAGCSGSGVLGTPIMPGSRFLGAGKGDRNRGSTRLSFVCSRGWGDDAAIHSRRPVVWALAPGGGGGGRLGGRWNSRRTPRGTASGIGRMSVSTNLRGEGGGRGALGGRERGRGGGCGAVGKGMRACENMCCTGLHSGDIRDGTTVPVLSGGSNDGSKTVGNERKPQKCTCTHTAKI